MQNIFSRSPVYNTPVEAKECCFPMPIVYSPPMCCPNVLRFAYEVPLDVADILLPPHTFKMNIFYSYLDSIHTLAMAAMMRTHHTKHILGIHAQIQYSRGRAIGDMLGGGLICCESLCTQGVGANRRAPLVSTRLHAAAASTTAPSRWRPYYLIDLHRLHLFSSLPLSPPLSPPPLSLPFFFFFLLSFFYYFRSQAWKKSQMMGPAHSSGTFKSP